MKCDGGANAPLATPMVTHSYLKRFDMLFIGIIAVFTHVCSLIY